MRCTHSVDTIDAVSCPDPENQYPPGNKTGDKKYLHGMEHQNTKFNMREGYDLELPN
jgi:hypothetical protein